MSLFRRIVASIVIACVSLPVSAINLVDGVKITKVTLGFYGSNTFQVHFDAGGPGTGACKAAGWVGFQARNWPYATNTAGVDTAQFDRIFSMMVTAFTTGQVISVEGIDTDCNSSAQVLMNP